MIKDNLKVRIACVLNIDLACQSGAYGEDCNQECSGNCVDGTACRNTDGYCVDGCLPGYTGNTCDSSNVYIKLFSLTECGICCLKSKLFNLP